jgi:hypothetical protein
VEEIVCSNAAPQKKTHLNSFQVVRSIPSKRNAALIHFKCYRNHPLKDDDDNKLKYKKD